METAESKTWTADELYTTTDLYIAAYLRTIGAKIVGMERNDRKQVEFTLGLNGIRDLVKAYMNGDALVNPKNYRQSIIELKDSIFCNNKTERG
jgi:hypothetical protein